MSWTEIRLWCIMSCDTVFSDVDDDLECFASSSTCSGFDIFQCFYLLKEGRLPINVLLSEFEPQNHQRRYISLALITGSMNILWTTKNTLESQPPLLNFLYSAAVYLPHSVWNHCIQLLHLSQFYFLQLTSSNTTLRSVLFQTNTTNRRFRTTHGRNGKEPHVWNQISTWHMFEDGSNGL